MSRFERILDHCITAGVFLLLGLFLAEPVAAPMPPGPAEPLTTITIVADRGEPGDYPIIGNTNTQVFHSRACSYLPQVQNRVYFSDLVQADFNGYQACKHCCTDEKLHALEEAEND